MAVPAPAAVGTRRERLRGQTTAEIKHVAREQMAREGTASVSLRQIAAAMGMTAPALYRYYASRDDLLTALIADSYTALADAIEAAANAPATGDYAARMLAGMLAFREWAIMYPTEFALIYGSPIPGYNAPEEETGPAAARPGALYISLMHDAWRTGMLTLPPTPTDHSPALVAQLGVWQAEHDYDAPPAILYLTLVSWTAMYGMIAAEVFGHSGEIVRDPGAFYRAEMITLLARMGLHVPPDDAMPSEGGVPTTDV